MRPEEWHMLLRTWPDVEFSAGAWRNALTDAWRQSRASAGRSEESWQTEGPGNLGGRFNCIAIDPSNTSVMYAGAATGGVFKTTDNGATWNPVFDAQPFLAIGAITIDPQNSNRIWVGTGDKNISGYCYTGNGIYLSEDGGVTWTHKGLGQQYIIADIAVDPGDSNTLYAAAMGNPFQRDENRGLYKSTDGGITWQQILYTSDDSGVIDLAMSHEDPQTLYAATYNRIRTNSEIVAEGEEAGIWKTTDGGVSWAALSNGLPSGVLGRIGICMYPGDDNRLYAVVVDTTYNVEGVYKTTNGGENWSALPTESLPASVYSSFGWYFGEVFVNPENPDQVYITGVDSYTMTDGSTWQPITPPWWEYIVHADSHDMAFIDGSNIVLCTDGGLYRTSDNCENWTDIDNIPVNQCYHVIENPAIPEEYWVGVQDNGTARGNLSMVNNWERLYGGDGFQARINPDDPQISYAQTQYGGLVYDITGQFLFTDFTTGIDPADRTGWDMPFIMGQQDPYTVYCGTYRVYKMESAPFGTWEPISGDLSDGLDEWFDRVHTITTLAESPVIETTLYAGTGDGNVWVTQDGGSTWTDRTAGLPERYVSQVLASPNEAANGYVTHSGYRDNERIPHIHKSTDYGQTWTDISGDLPQMAVNDILVAPGDENLLFAATDDGVYYSENAGENWLRLGNNMPMMPVFDIEFNSDRSRLVAGTFARSVQTIDISSLMPEVVPVPETAMHSLITGASIVSDRLVVSGYPDYRIYDTAGRCRLSGRVNGESISTDALPPGLYFLHADRPDGECVEKFVVMR